MQLLLLDHGCYFATGVFLWFILLKEATALRAGLLACFTVGGLASIGFWSKSLASMSGGMLDSRLPSILWAVFVGAIVVSVKGRDLTPQNSRFSRLARVLGLTSYPLYLLHDLVGAACLGWLVRMGVGKYVALLSVALMLTAAAASIALTLEPLARALLRLQLDRATKLALAFGKSNPTRR